MTKIDFSKHDVRYSKVSESDLLDDGFESSVEEFTTYYHIDMLGDIRERIVRTYRMILDGTVVGYVTVSLAHLKPDATRAIKKKETTSNIPALLISHLAVHKDYSRRGIGGELLDMVILCDSVSNPGVFGSGRHVCAVRTCTGARLWATQAPNA